MKKLLLFILVLIFLSTFTYGFSPPPDTFQVYGILKVSDENGISFKSLMDSISALTGGNVFIPKLRSDSAYVNKYIILQATDMSEVPTVPSQGLLMLENGTRQLRYYGKDYAGNTGWHTIPDSLMVRTLIDAITLVDTSTYAITSLDSSYGTIIGTGMNASTFVPRPFLQSYANGFVVSPVDSPRTYMRVGNINDGVSYSAFSPIQFANRIRGKVSSGITQSYFNINNYAGAIDFPYDSVMSEMKGLSVWNGTVWANNYIGQSTGIEGYSYENGGTIKKGIGGKFWSVAADTNYGIKAYSTVNNVSYAGYFGNGTARDGNVNVQDTITTAGLTVKKSATIRDTVFSNGGIVPWDTANALKTVWLFPPYGVIDTMRVPDRTKTSFLISTVPLMMGTYRITYDFTEQDYGTVFLPKSTGQEVALVVRMPIPDDWEGWPDSSALVIQNSGNTLNYVKKVVIMRSNIINPFPVEVDSSFTYTTYKTGTHDWGVDGAYGLTPIGQGIKFGASKLTSSWTRDSIMYIRIHIYGNDVDVDPAILGMIRMRYKTKHGYH